MDLSSLMRTLGGLGVVLGILAAALWLVRRFDLKLPGRTVGARDRRLELVETLPIDGRRVVALVRRDGREHLLLIAPEGHLVLESGLIRDRIDESAADARREARQDAIVLRDQQREQAQKLVSDSFGVLVNRALVNASPVIGRALTNVTPLADRVAKRAAPAARALKALFVPAPPALPPAPPPAPPAEAASPPPGPAKPRPRTRRPASPEKKNV